jgi:hypothetical protein
MIRRSAMRGMAAIVAPGLATGAGAHRTLGLALSRVDAGAVSVDTVGAVRILA